PVKPEFPVDQAGWRYDSLFRSAKHCSAHSPSYQSLLLRRSDLIDRCRRAGAFPGVDACPQGFSSKFMSDMEKGPAHLAKDDDAANEDRQFVPALARELEVLSCFRAQHGVLGNQDIARLCGLPKSTVSRLTHTLTRLGYLVQATDTGKYQLGTASLALGSAMLARMDIRKIARPLMQELADFSGAMVSLAIRDRFSMLYVESCRSAAALTLSGDVGSRLPLATSASGRAWLVDAPLHEREQVLSDMRAAD